MTIRWPLMVRVSFGTRLDGGYDRYGNHRLVGRQADQNVGWFAPRWIAWLYRLLPCSFGVRLGHEWDSPKGEGCFYGWSLAAPSWHIGWIPGRRQDDGRSRFTFYRGAVGLALLLLVGCAGPVEPRPCFTRDSSSYTTQDGYVVEIQLEVCP